MTVIRFLVYGFSKIVLWMIFRIGFGLSVRGQQHVPRQGGCILACNHNSFLDPPLLGVASPRQVTFLARATLFEKPFLREYMQAVGAVSLRRGEADVAAVRQAVAHLRGGEVMAMFPEGGRQRDGMLKPAKRGVGLSADTAKVPIVPVIIQGSFNAMPPTLPIRLHRAKISVAFGAPIPYTSAPTVSGASRNAHQQLAEAVTIAWRQLAAQLSSPTTLKK